MATGFYHGHNVLKYRVLSLLFNVYKNPDIPLPGWIDGKDICEVLGFDNQATVTHSLMKYRKYGVVARSRKRNNMKEHGNQSYRWRITEKGINLMFELENRANHGFTLNRKKGRLERVDSYIGITKRGEQKLGLTQEDARRIEAKFMPPRKKKEDIQN